MAPDKLENGAQFVLTSLIAGYLYMFSQFAFYLSLSLSVVLKSVFSPTLLQPLSVVVTV